jgi:hypothetical protein
MTTARGGTAHEVEAAQRRLSASTFSPGLRKLLAPLSPRAEMGVCCTKDRMGANNRLEGEMTSLQPWALWRPWWRRRFGVFLRRPQLG